MKNFTFKKNVMHGLAIKFMLLMVFLLGIGTSNALAEKHHTRCLMMRQKRSHSSMKKRKHSGQMNIS